MSMFLNARFRPVISGSTLRIFACGFLISAVNYALLPFLPIFLSERTDTTTATVGTILSLWLLISVFAQIPAKSIMDWLGFKRHKLLLTVALSLSSLFPLALIGGNLIWATLAHIVSAIAMSVYQLSLMRICNDDPKRSATAFAALYSGTNTGVVVGPLMILFLSAMSNQQILILLLICRVMAGVACLCLLWALLFPTDEQQGISEPKPTTANDISALTPVFIIIFASGAIYSILYAQLLNTMQLLPVSIETISAGPLLIAINGALVLMLQPVYFFANKKLAHITLILIAAVMNLFSWIFLIVSTDSVYLILFIITFTAGEVFLYPSVMALIGKISGDRDSIRLYPIYNLTRAFGPLGVLIGTWLIYNFGIEMYIIAMSIISLILLGISFMGRFLLLRNQSYRGVIDGKIYQAITCS